MRSSYKNNIKDLFDKDFRRYLNASILYAEMQEPYRPLDIEDEIEWLKEWIVSVVEMAVQDKELLIVSHINKHIEDYCITGPSLNIYKNIIDLVVKSDQIL